MKHTNNYSIRTLCKYGLCSLLLVCCMSGVLFAQDDATDDATKARKPVKNTFEGALILDNQSVMVPIKGTFEMVIQHRFGTVNNGFDDLWGIYAPSNIRLGFNYAPISNLYLGFGLTKERMMWDLNLKYALLKQTQGGGMPFSLTYYANMVIDGRNKRFFVDGVDRLSYFHQLILARKITKGISLQVAPSLSYFNSVEGYLDEEGNVQSKMENAHFAISFAGRVKITETMAILVGVDQPLTTHPLNNPYPNLSFGLEISTSSHNFQIMAGNYSSIIPQMNNVFNQHDYENSQFLIGFNITRLWNW